MGLSLPLTCFVLRAGSEIRRFVIQAKDRRLEFTLERMDRYWIRQRRALIIR